MVISANPNVSGSRPVSMVTAPAVDSVKTGGLKQSISAVSNTSNDSVTASRMNKIQLSVVRILDSIGKAIFPLLEMLPGMDSKVAISEARGHFNTVYPQYLDELGKQRQDIIESLGSEGVLGGDTEQIAAKFDALVGEFKSGRASPELLFKIVEHQNSETLSQSAKAERNISLLNAVGTVGDSLSKFASAGGHVISQITAISGVGVAAHAASGFSTVASVAVSGLKVAAAGVAIPAQAAMIGRDVSRVVAAKNQNQQYKANVTTLNDFKGVNESNSLNRISDKNIQSAQEVLTRKSYYNQKHSITSSVISAAGGGVGIAASIGVLTGVGMPVGLTLSGVSIALSVGAGIQRSVYQGKEDTFVGKGASESAREMAFENVLVSGSNKIEETVYNHADLMGRYQMMVAENKLHSLIQKAIDSNVDKKDGLDAASLYEKIEKKADKLSNRLINGTTLLKSEIEMVKEVLTGEYGPDFFTGDMATLQEKLNDRLQNTMNLAGLKPSADVLKNTQKESTQELYYLHSKDPAIKKAFTTAMGNSKKTLTEAELNKLCSESPRAKAVYDRVLAHHLQVQLKSDLKFLRLNSTEHFINSVDALMVLTHADKQES